MRNAKWIWAAALALLAALPVAAVNADSLQINVLAGFAEAARAADRNFTGFSAQRGHAFFLARPATGKPGTPSCTSCHAADPNRPGTTRAGKAIAPMALSRTPDRFSDPEKIEKWFRRNCNSVLGRTCSAVEKGDFITFMISR